MSKELGGGMDVLFSGSNVQASTLKQKKNIEKRTTFIVDCDLLERAKAAAYWERLRLKDIVNEALKVHLNKMEKKAGGYEKPPQ